MKKAAVTKWSNLKRFLLPVVAGMAQLVWRLDYGLDGLGFDDQ